MSSCSCTLTMSILHLARSHHETGLPCDCDTWILTRFLVWWRLSALLGIASCWVAFFSQTPLSWFSYRADGRYGSSLLHVDIQIYLAPLAKKGCWFSNYESQVELWESGGCSFVDLCLSTLVHWSVCSICHFCVVFFIIMLV